MDRSVHSTAKNLRSEKGNIVLATGVLSLMLLFVMFALNAAHYYNFKTQLAALAQQVASFSGTFLPDPKLALQQADNILKVLKKDPMTGQDRFPSDLHMDFLVESVDPTDSSNPPLVRRITYTGGASPAPLLPIKSITVRLTASLQVKIVDFLAVSLGVSDTFSVRAEATAELVPTDVALVVENSNSVLSQIQAEITASGSSISSHQAFGMWDGDVPGRATAAYGSLLTAKTSKALLRQRQCFGKSFRDIKRAALLTYDLLSASATYRVGLVFTNSIYGEFNSPTLGITADSYRQAYQRKQLAGLPPDAGSDNGAALFYRLSANREYGTFEYPESRCAALTDVEDALIPYHPLKASVKASFYNTTFQRNLLAQLGCNGVISESCPDASHLAFSSGATLLARELLWITQAGGTYEIGTINPKYDYASTQFAILRAMDMLKTAPARADNLAVRRRIILVFADGMETPYSVETGFNDLPWASTSQFTRISESVGSGSTFSKAALVPDYPPATGSGIFENYCDKANGNPIHQATYPSTIPATDPFDNDLGIKLGVLIYGSRQGFPSGDQNAFLPRLNGHDFTQDATQMDAFRQACNTKWTLNRGRFLAEASPSTVPANQAELLDEIYFEQLATNVVRAIQVPELLKTNAGS